MGIRLWVDDLRDPASFRPGEDWHWAKTVTEAVRILATQEVAEVALDHDISHDISAPGSVIMQPFSCPETYEPVARYIALMPKPPRVSIHTANPAGREIMEGILADGQVLREKAGT